MQVLWTLAHVIYRHIWEGLGQPHHRRFRQDLHLLCHLHKVIGEVPTLILVITAQVQTLEIGDTMVML